MSNKNKNLRDAARRRPKRGQAAAEDTPGSFIRKWQVSLGLPAAAYATGLTVLIFYFSLGILVLVVSSIWLLIDWLNFSRGKNNFLRFFGSLIPLAALAFPVWLLVRPAPLRIEFMSLPGGYADDTSINGIKWKSGFAQVNVIISNDTDMEYDDFHSYIRTNLLIYAAGSAANTINRCIIFPGRPDVIVAVPTITTNNNGSPSVIALDQNPSVTIATYNQIECDKIAPNSSVTFTLAVAPDQFRHTLPTWVAMHSQWYGANKTRENTDEKCFVFQCGDLSKVFSDLGHVIYRVPSATMKQFLHQR